MVDWLKIHKANDVNRSVRMFERVCIILVVHPEKYDCHRVRMPLMKTLYIIIIIIIIKVIIIIIIIIYTLFSLV